MSFAIRDMFQWSNFTPGLITKGGTVVNPNTFSAGITSYLNLNTTTGVITAQLPTVPVGYSAWACNLQVVMDCIDPNMQPLGFEPVMLQVQGVAGGTATIYLGDGDLGGFLGYSGANSTVLASLHGCYGSGSVLWSLLTSGVAILDQFNNPLNHKIHVLFDAIAV